ncbi:hypothetical protein BH11BAC3_BH11BAC3_35630 [soil metagenome]
MKKNHYTIDDIQVGDEILFEDTHKVEHNLFWRVINKISNYQIIVEIREMGYAEKYIIAVKDVINLRKMAF